MRKVLPNIKYRYTELIKAIQSRLRSGKLTEKQKVKVFFYIKSEEIKNMTKRDLERAKKKYLRLLVSIGRTIEFLEEKNPRNPAKLQMTLDIERTAKRQCVSLLTKIDKEIAKR